MKTSSIAVLAMKTISASHPKISYELLDAFCIIDLFSENYSCQKQSDKYVVEKARTLSLISVILFYATIAA